MLVDHVFIGCVIGKVKNVDLSRFLVLYIINSFRIWFLSFPFLSVFGLDTLEAFGFVLWPIWWLFLSGLRLFYKTSACRWLMILRGYCAFLSLAPASHAVVLAGRCWRAWWQCLFYRTLKAQCILILCLLICWWSRALLIKAEQRSRWDMADAGSISG